LFSSKENMAAIRKGQSPYSVNSVGVAAALAAIRDDAYVKHYAKEVRASRVLLCKELDELGWTYFPSDANFVLVRFGSAARRVRDALADQDILVRDRSYELPGCVRITVGTASQTRKLVQALRKIMTRVKG
jgi:histidinol-phosphate aminotransferase